MVSYLALMNLINILSFLYEFKLLYIYTNADTIVKFQHNLFDSSFFYYFNRNKLVNYRSMTKNEILSKKAFTSFNTYCNNRTLKIRKIFMFTLKTYFSI